jgi:hypothetical protein
VIRGAMSSEPQLRRRNSAVSPFSHPVFNRAQKACMVNVSPEALSS